MGEYLTKFTEIQNKIYDGEILEAKTLLQALLNDIYSSYTKTTVLKDKLTMEITMNKLIPALDDLKKGEVTPLVKERLFLEDDKFTSKEEKETPSSFFDAIPEEGEDEVLPPPLKGEENEEDTSEFARDENEENPFLNENPPEDNDEEKEDEEKKNHKHLRAEVSSVLVPLTLDDYIGQEKAKRTLKVSIEASRIKGEVLPHIMIVAPYGIGKTTLARIIANEMDMPFAEVNATSLKDTKALISYFDTLKESEVLFIDEIHTLSKSNQTLLLSIMTEFALNYISDTGEAIHKDLPKFTLIGASTQAGELLKPFLNRFSVIELVDYTEEEQKTMVLSKFSKLKYGIDEAALSDVAVRSRGIPRTMEIFAREICDLALIKHLTEVDKQTVEEYFEMKDIDSLGLTKVDQKILEALKEAGRPLGLLTLESKCGIQKEDIEYRYEPYLIKLGFMEKTEKGRVITEKGKAYITPSDEGEPSEDDSSEDGASEDK